MSVPVYILRRVLQALPLLIIISVLSFTMLKLAPIDPLAYLKANPAISQSAIKAEEERLGLNKPPVIQYGIWLSDLVRGNLGVSTTGGSVFILLMQRAGNTLLLGVLTVFFTWLIAIPAGIWAGVNRGTWIDKLFGIVTTIGMSMPTFLLALLLLMVALGTHLCPLAG